MAANTPVGGLQCSSLLCTVTLTMAQRTWEAHGENDLVWRRIVMLSSARFVAGHPSSAPSPVPVHCIASQVCERHRRVSLGPA